MTDRETEIKEKEAKIEELIKEHDEIEEKLIKMGVEIGWNDEDGNDIPLRKMLKDDDNKTVEEMRKEAEIGTQMLKMSHERNRLGKEIMKLKREMGQA